MKPPLEFYLMVQTYNVYGGGGPTLDLIPNIILAESAKKPHPTTVTQNLDLQDALMAADGAKILDDRITGTARKRAGLARPLRRQSRSQPVGVAKSIFLRLAAADPEPGAACR